MAFDVASVKNLLIDLGGVLYEIDVQGTFQKYFKLLHPSLKSENVRDLVKNPYFKKLEKGLVEIDEFAEGLIHDWQLDVSADQVKDIWVNLLVGLYPNRISLVQALCERYNVALLSNTSRYHYEHYSGECKPMFDRMDHLFLSFDMGMLKPDAEIYQTALKHMGWKAEETLFLDDSPSNIAGAEKVGIQTEWIEQATIFEEAAAVLLKGGTL